MAGLTGCGPPSDHLLIHRFERERPQFEQLRAAACALNCDQLIRPDRADREMADAHVEWFRTKLRAIGASGLDVGRTPTGCGLVLDVWATGFAGTPAGYKQFRFGALGDVVEPDTTTTVVSDLDARKPPDQITQFERPLKDGWWIEYVNYP
ncbi:MAG TPA: hypothetical protein VFE10_14205 [Phenylobacterium sp.]|nr:hypothetical protein [Phenylobacterium sp.]